MGDKCHVIGCSQPAFDNCVICGQPTCKPLHGKLVGNDFYCNGDKARMFPRGSFRALTEIISFKDHKLPLANALFENLTAITF